MPVPLEQFVRQLEDSGIVAGETLADFIPPKAAPHDAEDLARELVRQRKLTQFQADELFSGNGGSLVLGNYVLLEKIGAGGMGQVYKARHRRMDRIVAVKLLPTAMTQDQAAIGRFEREVKAAARLNHPNIVTAFDADCANSVHFLVMEYVEGSDLAALVKRRGPLPIEQAVSYVVQSARGLDAAHAEGIVHRDIKPGNLLLDKKGTVKVLDMGLARIDAAADEETQAELTRAGIVMGTVDYMAPEQARDTKSADARADIYSLGCTLHYLLTGKNVFPAETLMAKLVAHRTKLIPSLRATRPEIPETLDAVFQRMLAKDVAERYQSMGEVIAALDPNNRGVPLLAVPQGTQQFAVEDTHTGMADFLQHMVIEPQPPVSARHLVAARQPLQSKSRLKNNRKPLLIGGGILGVLILVCLVASLRLPANRPKAPSDDFDIRAEVPVERHSAAGDGSLAYQQSGFDDWVRHVGSLPAEDQVKAVARKLQELNQGFDGKETHVIESGVVTELTFVTDDVTDISPVRALNGLKSLICVGAAQGKLADLTPIQGLAITSLYVGVNRVLDLSALKDMPLTSFNCQNTEVSDLSPLIGMPLKSLSVHGSQVSDLSPLKDMPLTSLNCQYTPVSDLSPLHGLPLTQLGCAGTRVSDLSPLKGMPLAILDCTHNPTLPDLSPLKELPLKFLACDFNPWRDIEVLRSIETLEEINGTPVIEFWQEVEAQQAAFDAWTKEVAELPAEEQITAVSEKLKELNPAFDGRLTGADGGTMPTITDGAVTGMRLLTDHVTDISPLRALTGLKQLDCSGSKPGSLADLTPLTGLSLEYLSCASTVVSDLSPLQGMPLNVLQCGGTRVADLSPLAGMPLNHLDIQGTRVSDLAPLAGMPLTSLVCQDIPVSDLSPLKGMQLTFLTCRETNVADLSPLNGMPLDVLLCHNTAVSDLTPLAGMRLTTLICYNTQVADLKPLVGMPLAELSISGTLVTDLSPLIGMPLSDLQIAGMKVTDYSPVRTLPLKALTCDFNPYRDSEWVRAIKTLETINGKPAAEFWKEVDAKRVTQDEWAQDVAAMPAKKQIQAVAQRLRELNPGFDGKLTGNEGHGTPKIDDGNVTEVAFSSDAITDISPLRALTDLRILGVSGKGITDLWPLHGMPLTHLYVGGTSVSDLSPLRGMKLTFLDCSNTPVADLSPLKGMELASLYCIQSQVADLSPVSTMPSLTFLYCNSTPVSDLSPLKGMPLGRLYCADIRTSDPSPLVGLPLTDLWMDFNPFRDTELLRSIKTLETINTKPAAEFWKEVDARQAELDAFIQDVVALPADEQANAVVAKLRELNPGFNGKAMHRVTNGVVDSFGFSSDEVTDISPIRALAGLKTLDCSGSNGAVPAKLSDLSPLYGMQLEVLTCYRSAVADLSPLAGMPLKSLNFQETRVADITPLRGMPLTHLTCHATAVTDISPLAGSQLDSLEWSGAANSDLSPLTGMPLANLVLWGESPNDIAPLRGLPLKELRIPFDRAKHSAILRSIETLETINGQPAAEFWKEVEAAETSSP